MKKSIFLAVILSLMGLAVLAGNCWAADYNGKKILYVNSYHKGYVWSDGEQQGVEEVLSGTGVDLKVIYMDTKNNPSEGFKSQAGLKAKKVIEEFKPDVVITADDNAFKHLIMPYYRDADLPVVFCGINWDASVYGAPYSNTTGMVEAGLMKPLYAHLKNYADGNRVGLLGFDSWNERRTTDYAAGDIDSEVIYQEFVKDFQSWKEKFLELQEKVDIIILSSPEGIHDWNITEASKFVSENVRVPVGTQFSEEIAPVVLIGLAKISREQGEYAGKTALRILGGEKPGDMPVVSNKKGDLFLNLIIADKLDVVFTPAILRNANTIIDLE